MRKQNNELIAKFLGYTQPHPDYPNTTYWYKKNEEPLCLLMFDSDWNWLIKAVEKIETIEDFKYDFYIRQGVAIVIDKELKKDIITIDSDIKINAVYTAVIEFIKYHNELNK